MPERLNIKGIVHHVAGIMKPMKICLVRHFLWTQRCTQLAFGDNVSAALFPFPRVLEKGLFIKRQKREAAILPRFCR